jgi:hypothetical protein
MIVKRARIWWLGNGTDAGGCLLTLAVTLLILAVVLVIIWPSGREKAVTGEVVGFGMRETERGSYRVAYVVADGVRDRVRLYPSDRCALGDKVSVRVVPRWWGDSVVRGRASQLCSPLVPPAGAGRDLNPASSGRT